MLQIAMAGYGDDQHLPADAAVEALNHAVGLGGVGLGLAMVDSQGLTRGLRVVGGEATATVGLNRAGIVGGRNS
jgi:hypothetical protein